MPDTSHLQWVELHEFGGLWTAGNKFLMPVKNAQIMSGCHPQPGGGLRAFHDVIETVNGNGLTATAAGGGLRPKAVGFMVNSYGVDTGEPVPHFVIITVDEATGDGWDNWRYWDRTTADASWNKRAPSFDGVDTARFSPSATQPSFALVRVDPFDEVHPFLALSMREDDFGGSHSGIWKVVHIGAPVRNTTDMNDNFGARYVIEHQSRIVAADRSMVRFTAPEGESFTATGSGFIRVGRGDYIYGNNAFPDEVEMVVWMAPVPPGDLLVATAGGRLLNIQGDLADPTVRELGRWNQFISQEPAVTPRGIFAIFTHEGIARIGLDGSVEPISTDLSPRQWLRPSGINPEYGPGLGQLAGTERFLFVPNPDKASGTTNQNGPLVYDHETGAWFTATHPDRYTITNPALMRIDHNPRTGGLWVISSRSPEVIGEANPYLFKYPVGGGHSDTGFKRTSTWEWQSSPLRDPTGRRVLVREVQINVETFNSSSTVAVTVGGTTVTRTLASGRSVQRFLFDQRGEYLDVTVKAKSNDTAVEAPLMEAVRIGWRPSHLDPV